MHRKLLPASAAPFTPRPLYVDVILNSKIKRWLVQTLKQITVTRRPLNSKLQHQQCLIEVLSSPGAIWTLTSVMLPKTPESEFRQDDDNPLVEAITNYQLVHIEAYVVYVDMVLCNEVAYKLTPETIDALVEYHKDIYCVDAMANTNDWADKEQHCKQLHENFVQDVNKFVFCTRVSTLEGLEVGGAGELLRKGSEEVKKKIEALMKPLVPPPSPRAINIVKHRPICPKAPVNGRWMQPGCHGSLAVADPWTVYPSSPSTTQLADSTASPLAAPATIMNDSSFTHAVAHFKPTADDFWNSSLETYLTRPPTLPSMLTSPCGVGGSVKNMSGLGPSVVSTGFGHLHQYHPAIV
ncbi:hypothetical protein FSARC_8962 [Fusarium sarcochroum]|uniref:Uncharacterized protein n=1 Tax=Fusarium sarcochroum TaxID=1208366 RepID=A0A8H4TRZ0_9HYPO|nr:hypothetical protein FSARC_8962 [Fusarium sarcochroum]